MIDIKHEIQKEGIQFLLESNNTVIPRSRWEEMDDFAIESCLLEELVINGSAVFNDIGILLEFKGIYLLTPSEQKSLGIPDRYPYNICVSGSSVLKDNGFKYKVSYRTNEGDRLAVNRKGPFIYTEEKGFLLSEEQYDLLEAIDEFNSIEVSNKTANGNLIAFDRIKSLSQKGKIVLDRYLKNENVFVPAKLKIEIEQTGVDDYSVLPSIEHPLATQFDRYIGQYEDAPDGINLSYDDNSRVRVVFNDKQKEAISKIKKKYSHVSKEKLNTLVEHPEMVLDPDVCDVSTFYSDRVIEIGLYKPKFYSFISPYKSSWIPSFMVEDRVNGTASLSFETQEDLDAFAECIHNAELEGKESVDYKGIILNLDDARDIFNQSQEKIKEHSKEINDKKILIIEENDESLGYSERVNFDLSVQKYDFQPILGLKKEIHLKQHQQEGVAWLQYLIQLDQKGCLLADDMGLGKTLQILSAIDWYDKKYENNDKPYLVVAPVSLLENWEDEYRKFFEKPRIKVLPVHSCDLRRYDKGIDKNLINILQKRQIILTNYETIRTYQFSFCAVDYSIVVLDEAQKIKTPGTMITSATKALKAKFRIAMTGTPVENTLVDLWCIMDFALPGLLGNCKEFCNKYQTNSNCADVDVVAIGNKIRKNMGAFFMRRLKDNALTDLPNKEVYKIPHVMPKVQLDEYKSVVSEALAEKNSLAPTPGYMLRCLHKMREISDHPYIGNYDLNSHSVQDIIESSAKMKAMIPILNSIKSKNEKVIIFVERREVQKIIRRVMKYIYGIDPYIINGETPSTRSRFVLSGKLSRQQAIDEFQKVPGFNIIIMSPVAAGMGLNVTGANHVIHYSRHWNPAKEEQATDRVYRIGQEKNVYVYYPIAVADNIRTFDQTLDELLEMKSELAAATLFPTERTEVNSEHLFNALVGN